MNIRAADMSRPAAGVTVVSMERDDAWIGKRVRELRETQGMSQRRLAALVGVTQPYICQIENGEKPITKRATLYALADGLGVPNTELTGQPMPARTREDLLSYSTVANIRAALDYPDEPVRPRSRHELRRLTGRAMKARMDCDYAAVGVALPTLLAELRAAYADGQPRWAGELLVRALVVGSLTLKPIGWQDLAMRLAEHGQTIAAQLGDAETMAATEFAFAQNVLAQGSRRRSLDVARAAADAMPVDTDATRAWRGLLYMHAGLSAASLGNTDGSDGFFDLAERLATDVRGDPWAMEVTPDNCRTWRVAAALENGSPERAPLLAARVVRRNLRTPQRISRLDIDAGRGHYLAGHTDRAVRSFLRAHAVAPSEVRTRPSVAEIVGQMVRDAPTPTRDLRTLAGQLGIAV